MHQVLKAQNLGKSYSNKKVVRDISIEVKQGEIIGLLGPNGAGKTTTFYMIMGLIAAQHGNIYIDDLNITKLPIYRRARLGIGYLPQEPSIFRGLNVEDNIMAILQINTSVEEERQNQLENLLAEFSITHLRLALAISLSGGERRRVEIARCLAAKPNFILLDEPLAGIDPIAVKDIKDLIIHLKDRGIGIIITDHNVQEALKIIDRAYIIHDGNVLMHGSVEDIINNEDVRRIYLGEEFRI